MFSRNTEFDDSLDAVCFYLIGNFSSAQYDGGYSFEILRCLGERKRAIKSKISEDIFVIINHIG